MRVPLFKTANFADFDSEDSNALIVLEVRRDGVLEPDFRSRVRFSFFLVPEFW